MKRRTSKFTQQQSDCYVKIKCNGQKPRGTDRVHGGVAAFHAQRWVREQQEDKAYAAQRLPEVPSPHVSELEALLTCNQPHGAQTAHDVLSENHRAAVRTAARLALRVTGPSARLCSEEKEWAAPVQAAFVFIKP